MENKAEDMRRLQQKLAACQKILTALGDETRQHILFVMISGPCRGSRAVEIAARTNLSRPAVSHHMQVLKAAGIVKVRREGTCLYYYLDPQDNELGKLLDLLQDIRTVTANAPDRSGE